LGGKTGQVPAGLMPSLARIRTSVDKAITLIGIVFALTGSGSIWGLGHTPICATQPGTYGPGAWTAAGLGVTARPGASINVNGALQACASHPDIAQRTLYTLTSLPGWLVWGCLLFLLWRGHAAAWLADLRAHHPGRRGHGRRDQGHDLTRRRTDAGPSGDQEKAGEGEATAIRLHLDELLGRREMTLTELSAKVGITIVNLSILKDGRARAIRFSTLARLCEALGCQPGELLSCQPGPPARAEAGPDPGQEADLGEPTGLCPYE